MGCKQDAKVRYPESMADVIPPLLPDPSPVLSIIDGLRISKAVFAALEIGVFDLLESEALAASACAQRLHLSPDGAERLLDACASLGLLSKHDGVYRNTPLASAYLVRDSAHTLSGYMLYSNRVTWKLWGNLEEAITEGTPRWAQTFGQQVDLFEYFFQTENAKRTFLAGMHGMGLLSSPAVARAFDLSAHQMVADLGGGTGHLAAAICEAHPHMQGIVFDLPTVIPVTEGYLRRSSAHDRIRTVGGDFFHDPLPPADLYCLGRILHDWGEAKIRLLLRKMRDALPVGGAVLLAEMLLWDDKTGPTYALLQSLNMLACTEGKERNLDEYRALFESEGFHAVEGRVTGQVLDAVLARKAA
ncbi:MAG: acetylserotonin O-methyltransferase [Bryobacterales bacterium]|nr:acetylserotonin O-methyltransferase [Bryobacterales bacterium]